MFLYMEINEYFEELLNTEIKPQAGFKGETRMYCSKCGNYQTPRFLEKCNCCGNDYDLQPKTEIEVMKLTSHLQNGSNKMAHYAAAVLKRKLISNGYSEDEFINYCVNVHGISS